MVNDRNFQQTLETLCLDNYLHELHILWQTTVVVTVELSSVNKYPKSKWKFSKVVAKLMEKKSREELKRGCTPFNPLNPKIKI